MKFKPRDEYEKEAFALEPPKFDIGQRVRVTRWQGGRENISEGVVTDIHLRTVNWPLWLYSVNDSEVRLDNWMLADIEP